MAYDNITSLIGFWQETNTVTDNTFSYLFLVCIFLITYVALNRYETKAVFVASSALTTFICVLMFIGGIVPQSALTICIILTVASVFMQLFGQGGQ